MMKHIYILRHGQSVANAQRFIAGQHESPLSELGIAQAEQAAKTAAEQKVDLLVSSPMQRARQTAEIIARQLGDQPEVIQTIPELIERNLGELEGQHYSDTALGSGNTIAAEKVPGIEPIKQFYDRTKYALELIRDLPGKHILVVCHNGTGRMLLNIAAGGGPLGMYSRPRLENAVIYPLLAPR